MTARQLFESNLPLIEQICASISRRYCLSAADAEDFRSEVQLHLMDDDYAVLRKFDGGSSLKTYLSVVIRHYFLDLRNARWGKWRPSTLAKRLGSSATLLDILIWRDGHSVEEAVELLKRNHHVRESRAELEEIAVRLPSHPSRRPPEGEEALTGMAADDSAETELDERWKREAHERVEDALPRALAHLAAEEALLIRLLFLDRLSVAAVSRALKTKQRALYSRRDRCLKALRERLEEEGLSWEEIRGVLGWDKTDLSHVWSDESVGRQQKSLSRPSIDAEES